MFQEMLEVLRDGETQWMVLVCLGIYLAVFTVLGEIIRREAAGSKEGKWSAKDASCCWWAGIPPEPHRWDNQPWESLLNMRLAVFWLCGLVTLAMLAYVTQFAEATRSTHALTLVGGVVLGQGAGLWEARLRAKGQRLKSGTVVVVLVVLLAAAAVWQAEPGLVFQYRGLERWSGPWDNPNTFGLLMGVGVVLAVGRLTKRLKAKGQRLKDGGGEHRTLNWAGWVAGGFYLAAAGAMGVGLLKSYSRGAWVGAAAGLTYLAVCGLRPKDEHPTLNLEPRTSNGSTELPVVQGSGFKVQGSKFTGAFTLAVVMVSLMVTGLWGLRHTQGVVARRVYSVANANDFSWRNRVAAYEGALQMMADKPWFGFGWNQPEPVYDQYYRAAKVNEGMAIQLNDYFTLGATLGIPALLCFVIYAGLALSPKSKRLFENPSRGGRVSPRALTSAPSHRILGLAGTLALPWASAMPAVCRAGAIVLLVGFWFDGGLFKLATGATFWILLELGREEAEQPQMDSE